MLRAEKPYIAQDGIVNHCKSETSLKLKRLSGVLGRMDSSYSTDEEENNLRIDEQASVAGRMDSSYSTDKEENHLRIEKQAVEVSGTECTSSKDSEHLAPVCTKVDAQSLQISSSASNPTGLLKPASLPPLSSGSPVSADEGYLSSTPHTNLPFSNFLNSLSVGNLNTDAQDTHPTSHPECSPLSSSTLVIADESVPDTASEIKVESEEENDISEVSEEILMESKDFDGYSSDGDVPVLMLSNGDIVAAPKDVSSLLESSPTSKDLCIGCSVGVENTKSPKVSWHAIPDAIQ